MRDEKGQDPFTKEFKVSRFALGYEVSREWLYEPSEPRVLTRRQKIKQWLQSAWRRFTTYFERWGYTLIGRDAPWTETEGGWD